MNQNSSSFRERIFHLYLDCILRRHKLVVITTFVFMSALIAGIPRLTISNDFRVYFSADNPQLAALDELEQTYSKQDNLYFLIRPIDTDVFTKEILTLVLELTESGWTVPYSQRVSSLANYQHTRADGDDLFVNHLITDSASLNDRSIIQIRRISLEEPALVNSLVASDGSATGVNITLTLPENNPQASEQIVNRARELIAEFRQRYPEAELLLAGSVVESVTLAEAVKQDLQSLVFFSLLIISLGLLIMLRSASGMFATLLMIALAVLATMGVYGWFGTTLSPTAGFVPSIVMTIAVADSVHILVSYFHEFNHGRNKIDALKESLRINAAPVFITSVTTSIGVLTLNFSDSPPYRDLGNMVAIGVMFAYVLSMCFLPALMTWLPAGKRRAATGRENAMHDFAEWVITQKAKLLIGGGAVIIVVASFIARNELTERWHEYFDETFEIRLAVKGINEDIGGIHSLQYNLDSGVDDGINEPGYLSALEGFAEWFRQQPGVSHVSSVTNTIKRLNKNLHGDDPTWYRLPDDRALAAQYLLLYELSLPLGLGLDNTVNISRSASRFGVIVKETDSEALLDLDRRAQSWLAENAPQILPVEGTGLDLIFAHIMHRNIRGLLIGTAFALILISFVLIAALRSIKLGLISLVPNLAPAALAYGAWGLTVGHIDLALSVVIAMSLGIVVDDTVHFLSKYSRARREKNLTTEDGIRYAFRTVGIALIITTVVLVAGFSVLATSHFTPTRETGTLLAITLFLALISDFLFLPPLLMISDRKGKGDRIIF